MFDIYLKHCLLGCLSQTWDESSERTSVKIFAPTAAANKEILVLELRCRSRWHHVILGDGRFVGELLQVELGPHGRGLLGRR